MRRRWLWLASGLVGAAAIAGATFRGLEAREERAALARAKRDLLGGFPAKARRPLGELAARRPGWGEVEFHLGVAELALGRAGPALAAFARVPSDSEFAGWAAVHRAGLLVRRGQLSGAERLYEEALERRGAHRSEACWELVRLLRLEGRFDEAGRLFRRNFAEFPHPEKALRDLVRLEFEAYPAEGVRAFLDESSRQAPDEDRVWLGRAYLATRSGRFDEADNWLRACLDRRPDDPAVWRLRLDWAVAADRPEELREALRHVPDDEPGEARLARLRAWLAARSGDREAERAALRERIEADPSDAAALARLAELEVADGHPERADDWRKRRQGLERARAAYQDLLKRDETSGRERELARLAGELGRTFEARCWEALARGVRAGTLATAGAARPPGSSRSLADRLDLSTLHEPVGRPGEAPVAATPEIAFRDDAEASGLRFVHESGASAGRLIPPVSSSGGLGLLDYDGDGWLDVYAVQSGRFPEGPSSPGAGDRLFHNRGDGTFEDATESAGLAGSRGYGHGVAVGDADGDGHPDLFLTRWRRYVLLRNRGDGTFEDATESWGLAGDRDWPTSAAFADLDGDGDLDLYVCHYLSWDEGDRRTCVDPDDPTRYSCSPLDFPALADHLYRNDGGRFVDVTEEAGIVDRDGRGLGVLAADLDGDGLVDLFVANDMTPDRLYRNLGGLRFEEVGQIAGVAGNASGGYQAGMGVAFGDLDGDGRLDLVVTNYFNESTTFFHNLGLGQFADHSGAIGLAALSRHLLGFGVALPDLDDDGRLDLLSANGHVFDGRPQFPWRMPLQLLRGTADGRLEDVSGRAGPAFSASHIARGLAVGDLDNDGRLDAVVQAQDEPLVFLHNRTEGGSSLTLRLEGGASNRDAVGAIVTVEAGGRRQVATRAGGGSYQSSGDPRLHFGLGEATAADRVEVRWPSGRVDVHEGLAPGGYRLHEGEPEAKALEAGSVAGRNERVECEE
jgi:tetratricopeptide (TPR) repeat protein